MRLKISHSPCHSPIQQAKVCHPKRGLALQGPVTFLHLQNTHHTPGTLVLSNWKKTFFLSFFRKDWELKHRNHNLYIWYQFLIQNTAFQRWLELDIILVSSGCYERISEIKWLKQQTFLFHSSGGWEFQDEGAGLFSESPLPGLRQPPTHCVLTG